MQHKGPRHTYAAPGGGGGSGRTPILKMKSHVSQYFNSSSTTLLPMPPQSNKTAEGCGLRRNAARRSQRSPVARCQAQSHVRNPLPLRCFTCFRFRGLIYGICSRLASHRWQGTWPTKPTGHDLGLWLRGTIVGLLCASCEPFPFTALRFVSWLRLPYAAPVLSAHAFFLESKPRSAREPDLDVVGKLYMLPLL